MITVSAYWVFGIPLSALLVFYFDYGIKGLWVGPTFAVAYNTVLYVYISSKIDWQKLIENRHSQMKQDKELAQKLSNGQGSKPAQSASEAQAAAMKKI